MYNIIVYEIFLLHYIIVPVIIENLRNIDYIVSKVV